MKWAILSSHSLSLFAMASVQNSVDAYKKIHHDYQQLDNVKTVLMDCTQKLNNTQKSRKEIAKLTKLSLEVLDVVSDETKAGLKALAPSHSFARAIKNNEADNSRELAEETGFVMVQNDPEKKLREFLKRRKCSAGKNAGVTNNGSSIVSPSPKKARRSERQKLTQNDEHPYYPSNCKMFSPVELHNMLLPLDGSERAAMVDHFREKNWLHYKGKDPGRCVRRFMQKSLANPDRIMPYWGEGGKPPICGRKRFEEKHKQHLAQNLGMMVGLDKVKEWLREIKK